MSHGSRRRRPLLSKPAIAAASILTVVAAGTAVGAVLPDQASAAKAASTAPAAESAAKKAAQSAAAGSALAPALGPVYSGVGTHFDKTGDAGGGCGVPPAQIESKDFVALNVYDTPGKFEANLPRPAPDSIRGVWDNGLNCGRWVEIKLDDFCSVANGGAAGQGICRGGTWKPDQYNGATVKAVVTDSCGDPNEWCRSDRNHLDIARGSLGRFTLGGSPVGDLETMGRWNNRKIQWSFIPAPDYKGDIKIGLAKDASQWYTPVIITNLPNGIHGLEYQENGVWKQARMTGDNGQRYEIQPTTSARTSFTLRVKDADGKLLNGGREYTFKTPACASGSSRCTDLYTPVAY
ncbi:hypothetical protein EES43_03045 [Streptomyces sp. ADI96-02]|uniref:cellulose-binding protein n=1 Tax=unclassified Streptomyces TaxID=2593676 RepID=UPI000FA1BCF7|nr:cellulose-binding protein [Streptomyces sp. ADI96-02]RPK67477.1 hypothetical protein EES43_03045 [Streptomyces sp. ADI96-02]